MRWLSIGFGILLLTAFGAGVAELSQAAGHQAAESPSGPAAKPVASRQPSAAPSPSPSAVPSASPSTAPTLPTAVTNGFVHMRAGTSTNTPIVANLNGGTTVELTGKAIGLWQPVLYQGLNGYIYTSYLNY